MACSGEIQVAQRRFKEGERDVQGHFHFDFWCVRLGSHCGAWRDQLYWGLLPQDRWGARTLALVQQGMLPQALGVFWSTSWCLHVPQWPQIWSSISRKVTLNPVNYTDVQKYHKTFHTKMWTSIWQRWAMLARGKWMYPFLYLLGHVTRT